MKIIHTLASAAALTLALTGAARAVSLDDPRLPTAHGPWNTELTITENGQTRHVTLGAGEHLSDVCGDCMIKIAGGNKVHASGNDTVVVGGGIALANHLKVEHMSGTYAATPQESQQAQLPSGTKASPYSDVQTENFGASATPDQGPEGGSEAESR